VTSAYSEIVIHGNLLNHETNLNTNDLHPHHEISNDIIMHLKYDATAVVVIETYARPNQFQV